MALHFIFGGAGSGKTRFAMEEIIKDSLEHPEKHYLYIVPEQATMEAQRELVRLHPRHAIFNIEATSITRLAFRVFSETGFREESLLEEIGKTFLLEKVAMEQQKSLKWYGNTITRPEHLAEMKSIISEFLVYGVEDRDLTGSAERAGKSPEDPFTLKMKDLALLESAFRKKLEGTYMTMEELPEKLESLAGRSALIKKSVIVLDGFTGFTPIQEHLIRKLMTLSSDLYVTITIDADRNPFRRCGKADLFYMSVKTAETLLQMAEEEHISHPAPVFIEQGVKSRHAHAPHLAELERNLFRGSKNDHTGIKEKLSKPETGTIHIGVGNNGKDPADEDKGLHVTGSRKNNEKDDVPEISLFQADNPRSETEHAARMIARLVRTEGYRYRDFAVITGDLSVYGNYIRQIFPEYGIPCFVDAKKNLIENPFPEYLRAALEVMSENWSYDSMFRMLKSGMTDLDRDDIARLENYVRGTGVRGKKRWHETFIRHYLYEDAGEVPKLEMLRVKICELLDPLAETFSKRGSTVREKSAALYEFCVRSGAEQKMRERQEFWDEQGRGDLASEYEQVYPYVMDFLDKLVAVLGDEKISMRDYRALIEAGLSEARIGMIPSENDQVLAGDMERTRLPEVKVLLFLGVSEGLVPKTPVSGGVLTDADRETLEDAGLVLKAGAREQMYIDRFYMYQALARPSEHLFLSWPVSDAAGNVMRPSYLIETVQRMFPDLKAEGETKNLPDLIEREQTGMKLLTEGLEEIGNRLPEPSYLELFSYYLNHPVYKNRALGLLRAAGTAKTDSRISRETAKALYGELLRNSASRLELFYGCEFRHFLNYGLGLKERPEYGFTGLDMGSIVHSALEHFAEKTSRGKVSWADLAEDEKLREKLTRESLMEAVAESGNDVLYDTERDHYQIERMARLLLTTTWAQAEILSAGDFTPLGAEMPFRSLEGLEGSEVALDGNGKMLLTGRIDRVDTCDADGRTLVRIVDYKTGTVTFDLTEVYHGLELQLIVYLDAAMRELEKRGKHPVPGQILYYNVQDPVVDYQNETPEETRMRILRELRGSGYVLEDRKAAGHLDHKINEDGVSDVVPVKITGKGTFDSRSSKVMSEEEFDLLRMHVRKMVRDAGLKILQGSTSVNPYQLGNRTACDFCRYRSICRFDRKIPGCSFRILTKMKPEELFRKIEEEEEKK